MNKNAGMRTSKMRCFWFNLSQKLDRIVEQEKPGQTEEFTLAVLLECLNRLTGSAPTPAPPNLGESPNLAIDNALKLRN